MLPAVACLVLGWSLPPAQVGRREAISSAAALSALSALQLAPAPAFAQRSALVPKSNAESTASFKAYQLSAPGVESEAFKAAEKARLARANGGPVKKETEAEEIKRLGLTSYSTALDNGYDPCKTWKGCTGR